MAHRAWARQLRRADGGALPHRPGPRGPRPQLALRPRRDRHRRPRRRLPGRLRGQDPAEHDLRPAHRGGRPPQARPAPTALGRLARRPPGDRSTRSPASPASGWTSSASCDRAADPAGSSTSWERSRDPRPYASGGAAGDRRLPRRRRGGRRLRAAAVHRRRLPRRRLRAGPRPRQGGGGELRSPDSPAPRHRQPLAGVDPEGRLRLRPRHLRRGTRRERGDPCRCRPRGRPHRRARARRDRATGTRRSPARPRRRPEGSTPRRRPASPTRPRPGSSPASRFTRSPPSTSSSPGMPRCTRDSSPRRCPNRLPTGRGGTLTGPRRGRRAARGPARPRGRGRGRASPLPRRATRRRQDDARGAAARTAARAGRRPGHGGHGHRVGPRQVGPQAALERRPPFVAPHHGASPWR